MKFILIFNQQILSNVPMEFESIFDAPIYASFQLCGKEIYYSSNGIQG